MQGFVSLTIIPERRYAGSSNNPAITYERRPMKKVFLPVAPEGLTPIYSALGTDPKVVADRNERLSKELKELKALNDPSHNRSLRNLYAHPKG